MKNVVIQMIGWVNVLSRLKNRGIRIDPPVMNVVFARGRRYVPLTSLLSPCGDPLEEVEWQDNLSPQRCYSDGFIARFRLLVKFEQFAEFSGARCDGCYKQRDLRSNWTVLWGKPGRQCESRLLN